VHRFSDLMFTSDVQQAQERWGSRAAMARRQTGTAPDDLIGPDERDYLESRDGFFLATTNADGWPYVQFRGGPAGFVQVLDEHRLAWADLRGNRQYVSTGNLTGNGRVALIAMDWPTRSRLKLLGEATQVPASEVPDLAARLDVGEGHVERVVEVRVRALDWNCQQHITPRFTAAEVRDAVAPLQARIADLEAQLAAKSDTAADL
jgi:uncharacterized protein